jgi:hypothetical protein
MGFTTSTGNAGATHTKTLVIYMSDSAKDSATTVANSLGVTAQASDGTYSSTSDVLVILGTDQS